MTDVTSFAVAVDLVVLTVQEGRLRVLLVQRGIPPFEGAWALPGGFVLAEEDLAEAAARELREETGVPADLGHLEQLATFGAPGRDPRGRVVSVAYLALLPDPPVASAGSDAASAAWWPVDGLDAPLAFDHDQVLSVGVERARAKLEYTSLAAAFCAPEFTVAELRAVYEAVWGTALDPRNFHRKVTTATDFLVPTGASTSGDRGRPAALYRRGSAALLYPPMMRPE
jgi:ADP-ribose pyrophosphatase YjhB (NUDIX family)